MTHIVNSFLNPFPWDYESNIMHVVLYFYSCNWGSVTPAVDVDMWGKKKKEKEMKVD